MRTMMTAALVSALALPVAAATLTPGPCAAGTPFSLGTSVNVVVTFRMTRPAAAVFGAPAFTISGNAITVTRRVDGAGGGDACASDSIDLGSLPAGTYDLTWNDQVMGGTRSETYRFFVGQRVSFDDYIQPSVIAPVPPLLPGKPVQLLVNWCTVAPATIGAPVADLAGGTIRMTQGISSSGTSDTCALYLVDVGNLPPRRYDVSFNRRIVAPPDAFDESAADSFIVQQPAATASCDGRPLAVSLTPEGTARLHFEDSLQGYDPSFGPPSVVSINESGFGIEQPLTDSAGVPPGHKICHAEELDLGVLAPNLYGLSWGYVATPAGKGPSRLRSNRAFIWSGSEVLCTTEATFSTDPISPIAGSGVLLSLTRMSTNFFVEPTTATVSGNDIEVADYINTEVPPLPFPGLQPPRVAQCVTSSVSVQPLAEGKYFVHWVRIDRFGPPTYLGTYTFTVGPRGRRRAAR